MKNTRLMLIALLVAGAAAVRAAEEPAQAASSAEKPAVVTNALEPIKLSDETNKQVNAGLPKFDPAKPEMKPKNQPNVSTEKTIGTSGEEVLELDKMTIRQQPRTRPRLTPQAMMTAQGFNEKLAKERLSQFDRNGLNKFTLPLFGQSAADRAREEYDREQNSNMRTDVLSLAKAVEVDNPAQAAELRKQANK